MQNSQEGVKLLNRSFTKKANFVTREIAGETIIVPVRNHVGDLNSIYTLNELGTRIWHLIDGQKNLSQIVEEICGDYEVTQEEATRDSIEFLNSLQKAGIIALSNEDLGLRTEQKKGD